MPRAVCHIVYRQTKKRRKVKENNSGKGKNFQLLPFIICHIVYEDERGEMQKKTITKNVKSQVIAFRYMSY